jgi:hypothetical protein
MKNKEKITINGKEYEYSEFYDRLEIIDNIKNLEQVACPKCNNTFFSISYGNYQCIANCKCGHKMEIYGG